MITQWFFAILLNFMWRFIKQIKQTIEKFKLPSLSTFYNNKKKIIMKNENNFHMRTIDENMDAIDYFEKN